MLIPIYYIILPTLRDFIFEPISNQELAIYVYLVNADIYAVIVRNDIPRCIVVPRNFRLGVLTEIEEKNTFYIIIYDIEKVLELVVIYPYSKPR